MKKTVSIQISGMLFHVDDDAYDALDAYLQSIRTHFAHLADRDEIVSDIESRIAETFSEKLKKSKQTVTLHDVEALMKKMGTVEDFEAFEEETEEKPHHHNTHHGEPGEKRKPRRLYRNPDDKVIAGVASGIASYFGIDPVIVRVLFVILGFMHGLGIVAYIVLWIAMPMAKTHSQHMEMRGEPVTLSRLDAKIQRSTHTFAVPDFTSVYTRGGIRLHIREGKECKVAARGSAHDLQNMDVHVENGQLRLERVEGSWLGFLFHGFRHLSFDITLPDLKDVDVAGACAVDVEGFHGKEIRIQATGASTIRANTHAKILHIHVEGASSAKVSGEGDTIYATAIGASSLNARHFKAMHGHADISGASAAHVYAEKNVDGHATGASSLCVYGAPTVTAKASGASSVRNRDAADTEPEEWHQQEDYSDHKKYSHHPMRAFTRLIVGIFQVIGGLIAVVTGVLMVVLIIGTILFLKTGHVPYLDFTIGIASGTPLFYLTTAIGFALVFVPLVLLSQIGGSLAQRRKKFSISGMIILAILWVTILLGGIFLGKHLLPDMHYDTMFDTSMQSFQETNFQSIHVEGSDTIHIVQANRFVIAARGSDDAMKTLDIQEENGVLTIRHMHTPTCFFCTTPAARIDIRMPVLHDASFDGITETTIDGFSGGTMTLSADGLANVTATVSPYSLAVTANGLSHITLNGSTDLLHLQANDLSRVDAFALPATEAVVSLHDLSHAFLTVTKKISGTTNDLSRLQYHGSASADLRSNDMSGVSSDTLYDERLLPTQDLPSDF